MNENGGSPVAGATGRRVGADVLVHPVRLRIVAEFWGRDRTTQEVARGLPDVPEATLYRHIGILHDAGVLEVVAERAVRGAVERTFRVAMDTVRLTPEDLAGASRDDHLSYFRTFVASMVDTFATAIARTEPVHLMDAGLSYNRVVVHLTEGEREAFRRRLDVLVGEMLDTQPGPDRRPYTLGSIVIPGHVIPGHVIPGHKEHDQ